VTAPPVRAARPEDLPAIMSLFRELADFHRDWRVFPPRETLAADMESRYLAAMEDPDALLVVVEDREGEVAGMALGQLHQPSAFSDEVAVELSSVVVRPARRRRGVGRALSEEVRRFAHRRGARYVTLKSFARNEEGTAFWERMGFAPRVIQMVAPALPPEDDPSPERSGIIPSVPAFQ
jgi:ribosomal protein S18 acetylase RimI-like enzyme